MKINRYIYIVLSILLAGCTEEMEEQSLLHGELLGQGVSFSASMAEPFATRATYRHDGSFNEGDIMTIYRQYSPDAGISFDSKTEAYRVYYLFSKYVTGTSVALDIDWKPQVGAKGSNAPGTTFVQTAADSLTWENGRTVRFRSWSRSNLAGCISSKKKGSYYPDYCVSEWVTVSGPTLEVPLTLRHQGCRIGFTAKSGNQLAGAELCTDYHDYMRQDNAGSTERDESTAEHGKTEADAQAEADAVKAVYEKMCMPSGVDIYTSLLRTMTKTLYDNTNDFSDIPYKSTADGIVSFGTKTSAEIRDDVQRPLFAGVDGRMYMVTIPYDMSTDGNQGETLRLPACTRFRVKLFDVNDGDKANTDNVEATYHIFALSDIKDENGDVMFPDGLELIPGYSYLFSVGYRYESFTITPVNNFSWVQQDQETGRSEDEAQPKTNSKSYQWWKDAINAAIPKELSDTYDPEFHIKSREEFLEFIKLVNGTAVPDSVVYNHYFPAIADQPAYTMPDTLRGPYSFYEEGLDRHFKVYLDCDLDFFDWKLTAIGNESPSVRLGTPGAHPFRGEFNGQMHTLKNVYMDGGYLFGHCFDATISNLKIETTHDFMLLNTAEAKDAKTGFGAFIIGVSIKAPSSGNPIAQTLAGSSYVVGCIYEGKAGGAMVGKADNLTMYGNMMAASGLAGGTGALLGSYADPSDAFLASQGVGEPLKWGRFMVNYYDVTLSPGTHAVSTIVDNYQQQEYIRGAKSYVLKAKNDNLLADDMPFSKLTTETMRQGFYGLAPWKAMNYAIWKYNSSDFGKKYPCAGHYVNNNVGYAHTYPQLVSGAPADDGNANVLEQNN